MPSGTGKTVCNMSFYAALLFRTRTAGDLPRRVERLFFCTRTLGEMEQASAEARRVLAAYYAAYARMHGADYFAQHPHERVSCTAMSSRRQLCIHPDVRDVKSPREQDSRCLDYTQPLPPAVAAPAATAATGAAGDIEDLPGEFRCRCKYYAGYQNLVAGAARHGGHVLEYLADRHQMAPPVLSLEDLKALGTAEQVCPYYLSRYLAQQPHESSIVVLNYQYLLDPAVHSAALCPPGYGSSSGSGSGSSGGGGKSNPYEDYLVATPPRAPRPSNPHTFVVFDEAHNIDNVCDEALSRFVVVEDIENANKQLCELKDCLNRVAASLPRTLFRRSAEVLLLLRRVLAHLLQLFKTFKAPSADQPYMVHTLFSFVTTMCRALKVGSFHDIATLYGRYHGLLRLISEQSAPGTSGSTGASTGAAIGGGVGKSVSNSSFTALTTAVDFVSLVLTFMADDNRYNSSFMVVMQQRKGAMHDASRLEPKDLQLELVCLNPSIIFQRMVINRYENIVLTSGTMSPLDMYPKMLGFTPNLERSFEISFHREAVLPFVVSSSITTAKEVFQLSSKMEDRSNDNILRGYGLLLIELSRVVPDGMVVFFPSYQYMENAIHFWAQDNALGFGTIIDLLLQNKLLFFETSSTGDIDAVLETSFALHNYKIACDCGRGGILFAVARGKLSEGIDFSDQYGRCVVLVGMPFVYHKSPAVLGRMKFLKDTKGITESEFLQFDCMRAASQCVGRAIRNKADYAVLVFADKRYVQASKFHKLPKWLQHIMAPTGRCPSDTTSTVAQEKVRSFFRVIASSPSSGVGVSMLTLDQVHARQAELHHPVVSYD